jgi:hypothetical protein
MARAANTKGVDAASGTRMTELEVAAFRRDCAALAGHVRAGLRGDGFGETARQALDKLVTLAYGAAGMGEEA